MRSAAGHLGQPRCAAGDRTAVKDGGDRCNGCGFIHADLVAAGVACEWRVCAAGACRVPAAGGCAAEAVQGGLRWCGTPRVVAHVCGTSGQGSWYLSGTADCEGGSACDRNVIKPVSAACLAECNRLPRCRVSVWGSTVDSGTHLRLVRDVKVHSITLV